MPDHFTQVQQQNMNAEIRRNAAQEEARRAALDAQRKAEEQQRQEQREADAANPGVQRLLRDAEYKKYAAGMDAEADRVRLDAELKAKHDAELRAEYEAEKRIWTATGHPASTFDAERWPVILQRRHTDATAASQAERGKLIRQSSIF